MEKHNLNISLKDGTPVKCACGGQNFMEVVRFFRFSALLTGSPKDSMMPVPAYICGNCGDTLQDLLPRELQEKPKIDINNIKIENQ